MNNLLMKAAIAMAALATALFFSVSVAHCDGTENPATVDAMASFQEQVSEMTAAGIPCAVSHSNAINGVVESAIYTVENGKYIASLVLYTIDDDGDGVRVEIPADIAYARMGIDVN